MPADANTTVIDNPQLHRFDLTVDGEAAGFAEYHDHGTRRTFTHTVIDDAYEGRGLGSTLVRAVLDDAREHGLEVIPVCPFVRAFIARHLDEYVELVPEPMRVKFDLTPAE
ncbi:MAG TPA: GNAT family N-acetyltransferase [Mycobacteriales bacterium]|nr:GNAT family N-acetyltransferase [Mycobacteriales bacterium]